MVNNGAESWETTANTGSICSEVKIVKEPDFFRTFCNNIYYYTVSFFWGAHF